MRGTWQTTDGGGVRALLVIIVAVLAGSGGAAAAAASAVMIALLAVGGVAVLAVAAGVVLLVRRARRGIPGHGIVPAPVAHRMPGAERPAIPQHLHLHFDGADPAAVAEILRRHRAE